MCAASQQIDVIPNQGHDGIEAGNLGLMFAHAGLSTFHSQSVGFDAGSLDEAHGERESSETILHNLVI